MAELSIPSTPHGVELVYVEVTADVGPGLSTTEASPTTVMSLGAVVFDGQPVMLEFFSPALYTPNAAGGSTIVGLYEGATELGRLCEIITPAAAIMRSPALCRYRFTPSAASHTYLIGVWSSSASNSKVAAGAGGTAADFPAYVRVTKV